MKAYLPVKIAKLLSAVLFFSLCISSDAQVSGSVFRDFNNNGVKNTSVSFNDKAEAGIIVTAYNSANVVIASYKTNAAGNYNIPAGGPAYNGTPGSNTGSVPNGTAVRLEFSGWKSGDFAAVAGADNQGSVQFVTAPAAGRNFAISYPDDYAQTNPRLVTNVYKKGGAPATEPVVVSVDYNASGGNKNYPNISIEATQAQLGSTYGLAYHRLSNNVFAASYQKRNTSYGSANSTGAIYKIVNPTDNATTGVSLFLDLNVLFGSNVAGNNPHPNGITDFTRDDASYGKVGKISLGDLEISEDGLSLWTINLADRSLYKIPLGNDPYNPVAPASSASISRYPLWNLCDANNNGVTDLITDIDIRPFAVKPYRGKIYVGIICAAESTPTVYSNLTARVFAFDPVTLVFTQVLNFPLNYNRGNGNTAATPFPNGVPAGSGYTGANAANWRPWNDIYTTAATFQWSWYDPSWKEGGYSQAMFAGLDFDDDGNMIIGLRDRFGDMIGDGVYEPGGTIIMEGNGNGDLLRAVLNAAGTGWNFVTSEATAGTEFFKDDNYNIHEETCIGGVAVNHGFNHIINTVMDPVNNLSGGFDWTRFSDGGLDRSYEIDRRASGTAFTAHMFAKANAMGDVELLGNASPAEIGNRIWIDTNGNGLQDANEAAKANVTLELFADFNKDGAPDGGVISSIVTNAAGEWYFNNSNIADGDPVTAGNQPGLKLGAGYIVRIGAADWDAASGAGINDLYNFYLTLKDAIGPGIPDITDNDAVLTTGIIKVPQIQLTAGLAGQNNHNYDFGFMFNPLPVTLISFTVQLNSNKQADLKWTTVSEINLSHFVIERSTDGRNFTEAGVVFAKGNMADITNYSFLDNLNNIQSGIVYYRLRSVDNDDKYQLSTTRLLQLNNNLLNAITVSAYPNPVINELRVTIPAGWQNKEVAYELYSINGKLVSRKQTKSSSQTETINTSNMQSGIYFIKAICGNEVAQKKIIKQ